ncbi:unnamed protein product [Meloidogyne enterolobii]|uniref:Uncharacterized protein n=2 Tax=Meloidogyne enterolobii TaxID=390850 RepID=A0A6V7V897_MELEN|nr:unnamed protein product [Meloidogyne enterolobii]
MNKFIIFQFFVLIQLFLFYEAFLTAELAEVEVLDPNVRLRAKRLCTVMFCYDRCPGVITKNPC